MEPWDELYSPENDFYFDQTIDGQYDAWKASREEEIELPEINSDRYFLADGVFNLKEDITENILAAGFKVKGG
ncbi:hypothetical protein [Pluralibacter gergoviae]|uniref:hypothetical protein n=1 Tax=Pluralibacter gergoviae TaxID=61647 RepID=UPI001FF55765|nr:hypothetical protein [Pluralibacter gergoviae]MCK1065047.1 hypothetical protein [Pluralibacter gergoviae]